MKKSLFMALSLACILNAQNLATYGKNTITEKDIDPIVLPNGQAISVLDLNKDQQKEVILDYLFAKQIVEEAKSKKYEKDAEFKDALAKQNEQLLLNYYHKKTIDSQKVTDKEINDFYNKNKTKFTIPAQSQVAHILVKTQKEADEIIKQLKGLKDKALVDKFIELAKTKSIEPAAKQTGGVLPPFSKDGTMANGGGLVKEFVDGANSIKMGEISKAVKSQFGYHIILKLSQTNEQIIPLDNIKNDIKTQLQMEKYKKFLEDKKSDFVKKAKVDFK